MSPKQELKLSKAQRRKKFGKWINYDLMYEARGYGKLVGGAGIDKEWGAPTCSRCSSSRIVARKHFQDWCSLCWVIKNYEWKLNDLKEIKKKIRRRTREVLLKCARWFEEPSPYTRR